MSKTVYKILWDDLFYLHKFPKQTFWEVSLYKGFLWGLTCLSHYPTSTVTTKDTPCNIQNFFEFWEVCVNHYETWWVIIRYHKTFKLYVNEVNLVRILICTNENMNGCSFFPFMGSFCIYSDRRKWSIHSPGSGPDVHSYPNF